MSNIFPAWPLLGAFLAASLVLAITPGPGVVYIVTRSLDQGRRAGVASVMGVALGNFGNALAAAIGLGALLAASSTAFLIVKYAGAAYLIYLGVRAFHAPNSKPRDCFGTAAGRVFAADTPRRLRSCVTESEDGGFFRGLSASIHECKCLPHASECHARHGLRGHCGDNRHGICIGGRRRRADAEPCARRQPLRSLSYWWRIHWSRHFHCLFRFTYRQVDVRTAQ